MSEKHTFRGVIEATGSGGAFVVVPFDVEQAFGKKRVPVHATFDGVAYRGSLVRWIEEAEREQTRKDRVARALEMLGEGKKLR